MQQDNHEAARADRPQDLGDRNRYSSSAEKRQALDAWARNLKAIVEGEAGENVVAFARK